MRINRRYVAMRLLLYDPPPHGLRRAGLWLYGVVVLILLLSGALPLRALPAVTVRVDGQTEVAPVPRSLWDGQHLAFSARLMRRHERELLRFIPLRLARTHDSDPSLDLFSLGPGRYDFTPLDQFIDDLKDLGTSEAGPGLLFNIEFTPRWLAEDGCAQRSPRYSRPSDWGLWAQVVEDTVRHIRQRASSLERYYEVWNEPNVETFWMPCESDRNFARLEYYRLYQETALAVRRADPEGRIGGPALALGDEVATLVRWIPGFLDYCRDNALPLDFVSYHRYEGERVHLDTEDGLSVRAWLRARGMDGIEILNTEWNYFGGFTPPTADSEAMYGAVIPARVQSMAKGSVNRAVYFSAPDAPEELILPSEIVRPSYNVFRLLESLRGFSVATASDGMAADGLGVGVLAASDRTQGNFMVLLWNYRGANFIMPPTSVDLHIQPLPDFLRDQQVTYRRFLVDPETSNWVIDPSQDHVQQVDQRSFHTNSSYTATLSLKPNAVTLILFCRQDEPCPDLPSPRLVLGPLVRSVFVDRITENSATVTWNTSRPATSKVEYGLTLSYGLESATDSALETQHTIVIRGLAPNTKYYFRVVSTDDGGLQTKSEDWWSFVTPLLGRITRVFKPTDNTFVDDAYCIDHPDASFADASHLSVRDTDQRSFLRFDLSDIAQERDVNARSAELWLFAVDYGDGGGALYRTREVTWQEGDVNCRWQPRRVGGQVALLLGPIANGFTYRLDATSVVQQGRFFSFMITQPVQRSKVAYSSTRHSVAPPPLLFVSLDARDIGTRELAP